MGRTWYTCTGTPGELGCAEKWGVRGRQGARLDAACARKEVLQVDGVAPVAPAGPPDLEDRALAAGVAALQAQRPQRVALPQDKLGRPGASGAGL